MTALQPSVEPALPQVAENLDSETLVLNLRQQMDLDQLQIEEPNLFPPILSALSDPRQEIRISLIDLLGEIGEAATPWLCAALDQHPSPLVRQSCAKALRQIGDPEGVPALIQAFSQDPDAEVRGAAVGALAHLGSPAVAPLLALLADPAQSEVTQGQAQWAIATAGLEAPDLIYAQLNSPVPVVRAAVIGAIAGIFQANPQAMDQPPGIASILAALEDPESNVCCAAITALGRLRYGEAIAPLSQLLSHHRDPEVRQAAALGLLRLGNTGSQPLLTQQLQQEPHPDVRQSIELALQQLGHVVS